MAPQPRPWWSWASLGGIALLSLVLFAWAFSRNGMGNTYYAAVKSGNISWKAGFFGAFDPGSFITVDKLPASLWLGELSTRLFGFSSWSRLLPQALAGVASVLIVYRLVRRWLGDVAALLAALAFALTPVAIGGFDGSDPTPTLTEFKKLVEAKQVRYVLLGGVGAMTGGFGSGFSIAMWVKDNGTLVQSAPYPGCLYWGELYQLW